jgi:hypothetical protein
MIAFVYPTFRFVPSNRTFDRTQVLSLGPGADVAKLSSVVGEAAVPGAARKGLDTPEGFHKCHYKLLVYIVYCNYCLPSLQWSLENKMKSLDIKMKSPTDW